MSKSTKMIAALGTVAALGTAVMPFGAAFAEPTLAPGADAGNKMADVNVQVTIDEGIAMTVSGSSNTSAGTPTWSTPVAGTTTTAVDATAADVAVRMVPGTTNTDMAHKVNVSTSSDAGYTLTIKAAGDNADLVKSGDTAHAIKASTALVTDFDSFWYFTATPANAAVAPSGTTVVTGNQAVETAAKAINAKTDAIADDLTTINYTVNLGNDQAAGVYATDVTYTAAINS